MSVTFSRRYTYFGPAYIYQVFDEDGRWLGEVARNASDAAPNARRTWYASNRTWTSGDDLPGTFPSRRSAAQALQSKPTTT